MTPNTLPMTPALLLLVAAGCAHEADPQRNTGAIGKSDIAAVQECGVDQACPQGLECMFVDEETICTDAETACDLIGCALEDCLILESYPAQVACDGAPEPDPDPDPEPALDSCTLDAPCADGLECMFVALAQDPGLYCADASACELLDCPAGDSCVILETFPSQMICAPDPQPASCGIDVPCADGECMVVNGDAICTDVETACGLIGCALEDCLILETFPAQVSCAS